MRPLLILVMLGAAVPAQAQPIRDAGDSAVLAAQQQGDRNRAIAQDSAIVRLDAQIRTDRAIRDLQTRRVITPQAQATPQADDPEVTVQIPDDRLADSNARAKAAAANRD